MSQKDGSEVSEAFRRETAQRDTEEHDAQRFRRGEILVRRDVREMLQRYVTTPMGVRLFRCCA